MNNEREIIYIAGAGSCAAMNEKQEWNHPREVVIRFDTMFVMSTCLPTDTLITFSKDIIIILISVAWSSLLCLTCLRICLLNHTLILNQMLLWWLYYHSQIKNDLFNPQYQFKKSHKLMLCTEPKLPLPLALSLQIQYKQSKQFIIRTTGHV